jgi:hypothetical protein
MSSKLAPSGMHEVIYGAAKSSTFKKEMLAGALQSGSLVSELVLYTTC